MPLRGKEEDLLAPNMDTAMCVLNQKCKKVKGKPYDIQAVGKLNDRGHTKLLKDNHEETQEKFVKKPIQHWIPWQIVYKPKSKPTPVLHLMDNSMRTPSRPDA